MPAAPKPGAMSFAVLFAVESFARAVVSAVVSVQAYDLLKSGQSVSLLFMVVGLFVPLGTLSVPLLHHFMPRRWVYTTGVAAAHRGESVLCELHLGRPGGRACICACSGTAILNITLSLYILDHIRRVDLVRSEPLAAVILGRVVDGGSLSRHLALCAIRSCGPADRGIIGAVRAAHHVLVSQAFRQSGDQGGAGPRRSVRGRASAVSSRSRACGSPGSSPSAARASGRASSSTRPC